MGKWTQIKCNCLNRILIGEKGFTEKLYECGHKNGMAFEYWQGDLLNIAHSIAVAFKDEIHTFEVLYKISQTFEYIDELLEVSSNEVLLLKMELEEIQKLDQEHGYKCWTQWQVFTKEISEHEFLHSDFESTLNKAIKLCKISIETGNPIEFYL